MSNGINSRFRYLILGAVLLATGLWLHYELRHFLPRYEHYVSVKGIAELPVKSDLAIWNIGFKIAGDDLSKITADCLKNQKIITDFLLKHHFTVDEFELQQIEVIDQFAREYGNSKPQQRYIVNSGVMVRSKQVDRVYEVSQLSAELLQQGIVLMNKYEYLPNPRYFFTQLDEIRPQLLKKATHSARLVATQFALDSQSKLGGIRRASQGIFQILSSDSNGGNNYGNENDQIGNVNKLVRVVVSVEYLLKNNEMRRVL